MNRFQQPILGLKALLPVVISMFFASMMYSQSLADLARQERARVAREGKHGKVYTNADIGRTEPSTPPAASAPASEKAPAEPENKSKNKKEGEAKEEKSANGAAGTKETAKPGETAEKKSADLEKEYRDRFAKLRDNLATEEEKLDVMQRELNLMQTQYYSDPNVALREQTFRGQINQRTEEIKQQQGVVEKAKQAIADLQEELRKKNLPAGWAR